MSYKQRLSSCDAPSPIPASLDSLDLSHVGYSHKADFKYQLEDIPGLPIFKKNGKFKRFVTRDPNQKRVLSMPLLSSESLDKDLPIIPSRCVTSFNRFSMPQLDEQLSEPLVEFQSTPPRPQTMYIVPPHRPFSNQPLRKYIVDNDDDIDSLFSTNKSGTSNITTYTTDDIETAESILDLVQAYGNDSSSDDLEEAGDDSSSIYSQDSKISGLVTNYIEEPDVGLPFDEDVYSIIDSLFDDVPVVPVAAKKLPSIPQQSPSPENPPIISLDIKKSRNKVSFDDNNIKSAWSKADSSSGSTGVFPSPFRRPVSMNLDLMRPKHQVYQRPVSMMSTSNVSVSTCVSTNTVQIAKSDIKNIVRQRPYSYCLDSPSTYNYSRYAITPQPKITSNPYSSTLAPVVGSVQSSDANKVIPPQTPITPTTGQFTPQGSPKLLPPTPPPKQSQSRAVSLPVTPPGSPASKEERMKSTIALFLKQERGRKVSGL
ncbi:hypothetical protein PSN45_001322 [Yamadazyma tenuis]|uniref:Uncharacterized protein n=1 Tax=Candida tenuis (strain ATCC 10573 / BCRC 21748 / CBS 615 / JCM 9827 / NBRC 10315 / NRRL Y-1498 / VKM Y-70) TaxID=590646 RepID=G3BD02_CANTC|nr:uncharacterized protein CANTEDRAFT_96322 [Yamadazyma tenuis ATCC 10573]EGV60885.1 hypothetical protein CANTEDRAFT_96322 [Yamadazyma tenuis ATCC 10573]WEJ93845.1 hypothetical protein PSN45_001322 [Yamadazyma tenuis]